MATMGLCLVALAVWALRLRARWALSEQRARLFEHESSELRAELREERELRAQAQTRAAELAGEASRVERYEDELAELRAQRDLLDRDNARLLAELQAEREQRTFERSTVAQASARLQDSVRALGAEALEKSSRDFLQLAEQRFRQLLAEQDGRGEQHRLAIDNLVQPMRELLQRQDHALGELERKREGAYAELMSQVRQVACAHDKLTSETARLVSALSSPNHRGRWGELQLRRVVELAGMAEHCDFQVQVHVSDGESTRRPDMLVRIPGGGQIVVDAKVPLDAYLRAMADDGQRPALLRTHARQVRDHVSALAAKRYFRQFEQSPDMVVLFIPVEPALSCAMEVEPDLHAQALENRVLIATPMLLVALLRAIAYGWQQDAIAQSARQIARVGSELHERVALFVDHLGKLGRSLQAGANAYNDAVGSLERRVLVSARKLRELGATRADELEAPARLQLALRGLTPLAMDEPLRDALED